MKNVLSCSPVNLIKTQNLRTIWMTEAVFQLFYCSIFDAPFCYLVE